VRTSDLDLSAIIVCRDDEERVGHAVRRVAGHLGALGLRAEVLAVDEGSADNTLALLSLVDEPSLQVIAGVDDGEGFLRGAALARGRALLLLDARQAAPLAPLGYALDRLASGRDAVAVAERYLVLRRLRTLRALEALTHRRDAADLERRFLRRARGLGLSVEVLATRRRLTPWERLRESLLAPLASRA